MHRRHNGGHDKEKVAARDSDGENRITTDSGYQRRKSISDKPLVPRFT